MICTQLFLPKTFDISYNSRRDVLLVCYRAFCYTQLYIIECNVINVDDNYTVFQKKTCDHIFDDKLK